MAHEGAAAAVRPGLAGGGGRVSTVYAIFEGGGAKGITHIGALKALETEGLAPVGVAGTSAGAIIAALFAVGYRADELFAPDSSGDILARGGRTPIDLIGRFDWQRLRLRRLLGVPLLLLAGALFVAMAAFTPWPAWLPGWSATAANWLLIGAMLALLLLLWPLIRRRGMLSTETMRDTMNALLRAKLAEHYQKNFSTEPIPDPVRFRHLDPDRVPQCCRLKIVATDVRSGELAMFDHNMPDVAVADAVAASASIPFAFAPPKVRGFSDRADAVFADGGLVSNLPAWTFRGEKRAVEREQGGPPLPIIAFTLNQAGAASADETPRPRPLGVFAYIGAVLRTGIFGSQAIVQEFVSDLVVIDLPSPLKTLGFDCTRGEALAAYTAGLEEARRRLRKDRRRAELTARALRLVLGQAEQALRQRRGLPPDAPLPRLRAAAIDPVRRTVRDHSPAAFRVAAHVAMDPDPDDMLEYDLRSELAPRAFRERAPVFAALAGQNARQLWMTKYEHALIARDRHSTICLPVLAPTEWGELLPPLRVLCIDSSDSLQDDFNDPSFMRVLSKASALVSPPLIDELAAAER